MNILSPLALPTIELPTIVVLGTGGTIASTAQGKYGALAPSDEKMQTIMDDVIHKFSTDPTLNDENISRELVYIPLLEKDSSALDRQDLQKLSMAITELLHMEQVIAIIVSHGTDTMEESSYLIDITINPNKPVIFTGAMYAPDHEYFDGINNLLASVVDAVRLKNSTWIRMGDNLIPAQGAIKTAQGFFSQADTLHNIHLPGQTVESIQELDHAGTLFLDHSQKKESIVPIITCTQGQSAKLMSTILEQSDGLILKAMGSGNLPPDIVQILAANAENIPIAIVSRVHNAQVHPAYESGARLQRSGIILCNHITDVQLRILLRELLNRGFHRAEIYDFLCESGIAIL